MPLARSARLRGSQLTPSDVELFGAAAGDLLQRLGYERACAAPGEAALIRAAHVRERFVLEVPLLDRRPKA